MRKTILIVLALCFCLVGGPTAQAASSSPVHMRGLSTDTKPLYVAPGSLFDVVDASGNITATYIYRNYPDGTRSWVLSTTGSATSFYLASLSSAAASAITASAAELNTMAGITATTAELNKMTGAPASVTQTSTPATGTNGTQFVFKNAAGAAISRVYSGTAYISDVNGAHSTAITSMAALTNGSLSTLVTGKVIEFTSKNDGTLGITFTATSGSYYITFVLPGGVISTSTVLTVN